MYSIQTQNREIIYYRPELEKLYIQERNSEDGQTFQVRAVINENDYLLGSYLKKEKAQQVMLDLIEDNFCTDAEVYSMPEDENL